MPRVINHIYLKIFFLFRFILLLLVSKYVSLTRSYQEKYSSEKFYISPKLDLENYARGF